LVGVLCLEGEGLGEGAGEGCLVGEEGMQTGFVGVVGGEGEEGEGEGEGEGREGFCLVLFSSSKNSVSLLASASRCSSVVSASTPST
jgi:hypothetical protein